MTPNRKAADAYRKARGLVKETGESAAPSGRTRDAAAADAAAPTDAPSPPPAGAIPHGAREATAAATFATTRDERATTVATFLALLGRAEAAEILRRMPTADAERVMQRLATVGEISPRAARRVLARFGSQARVASHATAAGPETARELLVRAFGVEEGERRFYRLLPEERPHRFGFLDEADGRQLAMLVREESPATLAVLTANLPRGTAARLLEALPEETRAAVVRRVAGLGAVDPAVLESVETTLRNRLERLDAGGGEDVDGEDRLATILRFMDLSSGDRILASVRERDPELARRIEQRLTTFEDVVSIESRALQQVLQRVDDIELAIILKGKSEDAVARIEANVSERRREMIRGQRESLGPMPRRDVDRATEDFMRLVREMAAGGEIGVDLRV